MLDFLAVQVDVLQLILELAHAREHAQDGLEGTKLPHLFQLPQEIIQSEFTLSNLSLAACFSS